MKTTFFALTVLISLISFTSCEVNKDAKTEYLIMITDTINDRYGYVDQQGDTAIRLGKYSYCFTDTFRTYAIIHKTTGGFYAIDRNEKDMYEVFNYDNGPDYVEEGLFRIIENRKIADLVQKCCFVFLISPLIVPGYSPYNRGNKKATNQFALPDFVSAFA